MYYQFDERVNIFFAKFKYVLPMTQMMIDNANQPVAHLSHARNGVTAA